MMDVEYLRTLMTVAKLRSLTKAAVALGMTPQGVKRQMSVIEQALNITLFHGTNTGIQMTEEGLRLAEDAVLICDAYDRAVSRTRSPTEIPEGPLKVIISNTGMLWLSNHLEEFESRYPDIVLKFVADEKESLYLAGSFSDVFIGILGPKPKDSPFVWQKISSVYSYPFAHPRYLQKYGMPTHLSELDNHRIIQYEWAPQYTYLKLHESNPLLYEGESIILSRNVRYKTDDVSFCKRLVDKGLAIGMLPKALIEPADLVELFKGTYDPKGTSSIGLHLVFAPSLKSNPRVAAIREFVMEKWKEEGETAKEAYPLSSE